MRIRIVSGLWLFLAVVLAWNTSGTVFAQANPDKSTTPKSDAARKPGDIMLEPATAMLGNDKIEFEFGTALVSPIPVIFTQGDWDTQTPVENALNIATYFPNGRVVIAEHGGHGVLGPIADCLPEAQMAIVEFLLTGSTKNLPARVTLPAPKFIAPSFPLPAKKSAG